ncbi:hypothetical protein [Streptomyces spectabilis]|uniref:Uncharacterized protein n=1 Tax=Streptomyces spectabilis TaxID=68270 RepID=A0A5P2XG69_STRST|nr:hypothetical protein [Streptomyces spectabilis]MBB5108123.1 hypothetical protein [Streptomyces spectabilis]MCI3904346.1 hypothetical protein [Streptomyces spectabilis]QEV61452.1 hypothetical protein CP982_24380 [Streptomyces spectabilis]GGV26662.1 hypothetical protein GCM10010245_43780 [Streptomyces spectabilis]
MTIQYTPISNLPYPQPSDPADLPAHLKSLAEAVDGRTVMRFQDAASRDAKLSAPVAGMIAWIGVPGRLMYFTGQAWVPVAPVPVFRVNRDEGTTTATDYTESLADSSAGALSVSFTVPASGQVIIAVGAYMRSLGSPPAASFMSANVRAGTQVVLAADDSRAAAVTAGTRTSVSAQYLVSGLDVGTTCTATGAFRSYKADAKASFDTRYIRIDPIP